MKSVDPSSLIDKQIADLTDWRGKLLAKLRKIIHDADPELTEEWKWGTAVWSLNGLVLAAGAFKETVKLNFFQGAALPDPSKLLNAGLDAKKTRAIDFHEGDKINESPTTFRSLSEYSLPRKAIAKVIATAIPSAVHIHILPHQPPRKPSAMPVRRSTVRDVLVTATTVRFLAI